MEAPRESRDLPPQYVSTLRMVHIANLTRSVRAAHVREICEYWGQVSRVHLAVDARVGLPRGFAYVEFAHPRDADECCVNLDGGKLDGSTIAVTLTHDAFPEEAGVEARERREVHEEDRRGGRGEREREERGPREREREERGPREREREERGPREREREERGPREREREERGPREREERGPREREERGAPRERERERDERGRGGGGGRARSRSRERERR